MTSKNGKLFRDHSLLYLITGAGKRQAVAAWQRGEALPISQIKPRGSGELLLDIAVWNHNLEL